MFNYYNKYLKYKYKYLLLEGGNIIKYYIFYYENRIWNRIIINDIVKDEILIDKEELDNYITYNASEEIGYINQTKLKVKNETIKNLKILVKSEGVNETIEKLKILFENKSETIEKLKILFKN
jgi:hypothetical protein